MAIELRLFANNSDDETFFLIGEGKTSLLGRNAYGTKADILLNVDESVGRNHCYVSVDSGYGYVIDNNSKNGTYVERSAKNTHRRVSSKEKTLLFNNDKIILSKNAFLQVSYQTKKCQIREKDLKYKGCGFPYLTNFNYCPYCGCQNTYLDYETPNQPEVEFSEGQKENMADEIDYYGEDYTTKYVTVDGKFLPDDNNIDNPPKLKTSKIKCTACQEEYDQKVHDYCHSCKIPFSSQVCNNNQCNLFYEKKYNFCPYCGTHNQNRKSQLLCHHCVGIKFRNKDAVCVSPFCKKKNPTNRKDCQSILPPHLPLEYYLDLPDYGEFQSLVGRNEFKVLQLLLKNSKYQKDEENRLNDLNANKTKLAQKETDDKLKNYIATFGYPRDYLSKQLDLFSEDIRKNCDALVRRGIVSEILFNGERRDEERNANEGKNRIFYILNIKNYNDFRQCVLPEI